MTEEEAQIELKILYEKAVEDGDTRLAVEILDHMVWTSKSVT